MAAADQIESLLQVITTNVNEKLVSLNKVIDKQK
jgi:hypothetical protein